MNNAYVDELGWNYNYICDEKGSIKYKGYYCQNKCKY